MKVECSVCGEKVGRGPAGMGLQKHARMHRREFVDSVGRRPDSYQEVREWYRHGVQHVEGGQTTIPEYS